MLTPAVKPLQVWLGFDDESKLAIQFYIVCGLLVYSVMAKGYREDWCNNFEQDPFVDKFMTFQEQYKNVVTKDGTVDLQEHDLDEDEVMSE